ncbi:MAG: patatin-like phospholipase family protein [Bacteroidetes bacterium]|nr:patatin-like phospholipase family protein [Bacteroidota bacterium]MBU2637227.1 patatin-like phospholipase family protein [Bacteroidota bacterium]
MPLKTIFLCISLIFFVTTVNSQINKPKVALVLSGGGARGLAQIGVLKTFEKYNIPIDLIVGNSMGAIVGGLYCSGYTAGELEDIVLKTNWDEILSLTDETKRTELFLDQRQSKEKSFLVIRFNGLQPIIPSSISSGQRVTNFLNNLTMQALYHPSPSFDDLKIPFRAIATDIVSGRRITFDTGPLSEALRASVAVPLLFTPLEKDTLSLVDGGLVSNIPVDVAKSLAAEIIIVINSTSEILKLNEHSAPWETADQIMTIMMQSSNDNQLKLADIIIKPEIGNHLASDFSDISQLIKAGEETAEKKIPQILSILKAKLKSTSFTNDTLFYNTQTTFLSKIKNNKLEYIRFFGNDKLDDSVIENHFSEILHKPYNEAKIKQLSDSLLLIYRQKGYSLARIDSNQFDPHSGILSFKINEGKIKELKFTGNEHTAEYVLRREINMHPGDVFQIKTAQKGITNLSATGLFEYVLLEIQSDENKEPIVVIKVKEKVTDVVRLGININNERGFIGNIEARLTNFRGHGEDLGLNFTAGLRDRKISLDYLVYRIFHSYFTFNFKMYHLFRDFYTYKDANTSLRRWDRMQLGEFRLIKYGAVVSFGLQLERLGNMILEYRREQHEIKEITSGGYSPEKYPFAILKLGTTVDTKNKLPFTTEGMLLSIAYESAVKELGSKLAYTKLTLQYEAYLTLFSNHTFKYKTYFGVADATLPLAEQFSLGGLNSFLGLRENDSRGRQILLFNSEYRIHFPFKIVYDTYFSLTYDLGMISAQPQELKLSGMRHGIGTILGLDTPIGPALVGVGKSFYLPTKVGARTAYGPMLFYFSVGFEM